MGEKEGVAALLRHRGGRSAVRRFAAGRVGAGRTWTAAARRWRRLSPRGVALAPAVAMAVVPAAVPPGVQQRRSLWTPPPFHDPPVWSDPRGQLEGSSKDGAGAGAGVTAAGAGDDGAASGGHSGWGGVKCTSSPRVQPPRCDQPPLPPSPSAKDNAHTAGDAIRPRQWRRQ